MPTEIYRFGHPASIPEGVAPADEFTDEEIAVGTRPKEGELTDADIGLGPPRKLPEATRQALRAEQRKYARRGLAADLLGDVTDLLTGGATALTFSPSAIAGQMERGTGLNLGLEKTLQTPILGKIPEIKTTAKTPLVGQLGAGTVNAIAELANFFQTPEGVATFGIAGLPAGARKTVTAAWAGQLLANAPERFNASLDAFQKGDNATGAKEAMAGLVQTAAAGGLGRASAEPVALPKVPTFDENLQAIAERKAMAGTMPSRVISPAVAGPHEVQMLAPPTPEAPPEMVTGTLPEPSQIRRGVRRMQEPTFLEPPPPPETPPPPKVQAETRGKISYGGAAGGIPNARQQAVGAVSFGGVPSPPHLIDQVLGILDSRDRLTLEGMGETFSKMAGAGVARASRNDLLRLVEARLKEIKTGVVDPELEALRRIVRGTPARVEPNTTVTVPPAEQPLLTEGQKLLTFPRQEPPTGEAGAPVGQPPSPPAPQPKGVPDASSIEKATEVHGDLRALTGEGEGQLPFKGSGEGVQPQAAGGIPEAEKVPLPEAGKPVLTPDHWAVFQQGEPVGSFKSEAQAKLFANNITGGEVRPISLAQVPPSEVAAASRPTGTVIPVERIRESVNVAANIAKRKDIPNSEKAKLSSLIEQARRGDPTALETEINRLRQAFPRKIESKQISRLFDRETQAVGTDILDWLSDNMRLRSKSAAKKALGEKFQFTAQEYDDAPRLPVHHNARVYGGTASPDQAAQAAHEARILKGSSYRDLWDAMRTASQRRLNVLKKEGRVQKGLEADIEFLEKATAPEEGTLETPASDLQPGDTFEIEGQHIEVIKIEADGTVVLKDGSRWGVQTIRPGETIYVEKFEASPSTVPKLGAMEKGTGDLLKGQTEDFALVGERATDVERLQAEKAAAEKAKAEAAGIAAKQQLTLPTAETGEKPSGLISGTPAEKWADDVIGQDPRKGTRMSFDPVREAKMFAAFTVKGAAFIERGIRDFAAWSNEMLKLYGPAIQGHLKDIYDSSLAHYNNARASQPSLTVATASPQNKPAGALAPTTGQLIRSKLALIQPIKDMGAEAQRLWRGFTMQALPRITLANRETGEAGVRYAAANQVARAKGVLFANEVLKASGVDPVKYGIAISEDNLRDVKDRSASNAKFLADQGNAAEAAKWQKQADATYTFIGVKGSPFQTEAQWRAFLNEPATQKAIAKHKQLWAEQKDPLFRQANDLDSDLPLASRGKYTGARVNLMALTEELEGQLGTGQGIPGVSSGLTRQLATLKRKDPFSRKATGAGERYEGNFYEVMANGFAREYPVAMQHEFIRSLVDSGLAKVVNKGNPKYLLKLRAWKGRFLEFDRPDIAREYEEAVGLRPSNRIPVVTKIGEFLTRMSITGLAEGTTHASNLSLTAFTGLGPTSNPMVNALVKSLGRVDLVYTIPRIIIKGLGDHESDMIRLAEIGAAKQPYMGAVSRRLLNPVDKGVRLVMADIYRGMAGKGLVPDTETGLREFVNESGNYNKRLQPWVIRTLRETHVQPFATAVHTWNVQGARRLAMSTAARGTSKLANLALKADVAGGWIGAAVLIGTLNYLLSKKVAGPPGTPLGAIGWTGDDGKTHYWHAARWLGYERGLRITGIGPAVEAKMQGLSGEQALRRGGEAVAGTPLAYLGGPMVRFGVIAGTGYRPSIPPIREAPVVPPSQDFRLFKNQIANNIFTALQEASPVSDSAVRLLRGDPWEDAVTRQLSRYSPRTGMHPELAEKLPDILERADVNEYIKDIARRGRRMNEAARDKLFDEALENIDDVGMRQKARRLFRLVSKE